MHRIVQRRVYEGEYLIGVPVVGLFTSGGRAESVTALNAKEGRGMWRWRRLRDRYRSGVLVFGAQHSANCVEYGAD
jgi:hypothetical protein